MIFIIILIIILLILSSYNKEDFTMFAPVDFKSKEINCNELAYNPRKCNIKYVKPHTERVCNKNLKIEKKLLGIDNLSSLESIPDIKSLNSLDEENTYV